MALLQEEQEAALCTACGMCCRGAWFKNIKIADKEVEKLKTSTKLEPYTIKKRIYSPQPCPELSSIGCSIYNDRPVDCQNYQCKLLVKLNSNTKKLDDCLSDVKSLQDKYDQMVSFLIDNNINLQSNSLNVRHELGILIKSISDYYERVSYAENKQYNQQLILIYNYLEFVNKNFKQTNLLKRVQVIMSKL